MIHCRSIIITVICALGALTAAAAPHGGEPADTITLQTRLDSVNVRLVDADTEVTAWRDGREVYRFRYECARPEGHGAEWVPVIPFVGRFRDTGGSRSSAPGSSARPARPSRSRYGVVAANGLYCGAVIPSDAPYGMVTGLEVGMHQIIGQYWEPRRGGTRLSLGVGMGYRQQNAGKGMTLERRGDLLALVPLPEGMTDCSARIESMVVDIPLTVRQPLGGSLALMLSGVLRFNTYSRAVTHMTQPDGTRRTVKYTGLHQRAATLEAVGGLGVRDVLGVYVRYSPMSVWRPEHGPHGHSVSVGGMLLF